MTTILKTEKLTKKYGNQIAVDNFDLEIKRGDIYGLIGRNGAGKTTLMKMISGLSKESSGTYKIFDLDPKDNEYTKTRISSLIEEPGIYKNLNAFDNLYLKAKALGMGDGEYIINILKMVGLDHTKNKKVKNFSMGMKGRLGLGLALIGEPDLMILDEPINGLDPQGIVEVRNLIEKLNREKNISFLISSHILDELSKLATKFAIINNGKLIKSLTKEELENENKDRLELISSDPKLAAVSLEKIGIYEYKLVDEKLFYIYKGIEYTKPIINILKENNLDIEYFNVHESSLEDYYLSLIKGE